MAPSDAKAQAENPKGLIMERKVAYEGETFIVRQGEGECVLTVTNGEDEGRVTWHEATHQYRGAFRGWGCDASSVDQAVAVAARQILVTRKGVSQHDACEAMEEYIKNPEEDGAG